MNTLYIGGRKMSCRIIIDTGGETTEITLGDSSYTTAPLRLRFPDVELVDDGSIDQIELLNKIAECEEVAQSSCPSPEEYMNLYHCEAENVYAITISGEVSGSYNSAVLGKNLYEEEHGEKNIHVFNSKSASIGLTIIGYKIKEYEEQGMSFEDIIENVEAHIEDLHLYFVLEDLETLRKNGRLTGIKSMVASALNIKPYMSVDNIGNIIQLGQGRGINKALVKMVDQAISDVVDPETKVIGIAHCNNLERAEKVKEMILAKVTPKEIFITETSGLSTLYANQGGILIAM